MDLSDNLVILQENNVEAPKEAEIISINPDEIEITIERIITKEFPLGVINDCGNGNITVNLRSFLK